jgi:hypothetical protein
LAVPGRSAVVTAKPLGAQTTRVSDRSLDEFAGAAAGSDEGGDADDADDSTAVDADPSVPTMRWSADGDACDACGAVIERRWQDGEAFVCADCKEW